jgi:hypothetical protein
MKKITTVYLEDNLINLARLDNLNVSEFVNSILQEYLSVQSIEDIDKQIQEHQLHIQALAEKKKTLLLDGASNSKLNGMVATMEAELRNNYKKRREQSGDSADADFQWMNSPKNLQRCKILGKEPLAMVHDLRKGYKEHGDK